MPTYGQAIDQVIYVQPHVASTPTLTPSRQTEGNSPYVAHKYKLL